MSEPIQQVEISDGDVIDSHRNVGINSSPNEISYSAQQASSIAPDEPHYAPTEGTLPSDQTPVDSGGSVLDDLASVMASGCGCGGSTMPVYALGLLQPDFGNEARRDSFIQQGLKNPNDPEQLLSHLEENPWSAAAITWTLTQESTPIYAIQPGGPFADLAYSRLRGFLQEQLKEGVEKVSIPGEVRGNVRLLNGQIVPGIRPSLRGMFSWSIEALISDLQGESPTTDDQKASTDINNFLQRVYYDLRNLGLSSQDRAINFAATNAFQVHEVYQAAIKAEMKLDRIEVRKSPICRPESDCWDVILSFFNPVKRMDQARLAHRFTIDVSDVIPVTVGNVRSWFVY